jgi:hypothetical protein
LLLTLAVPIVYVFLPSKNFASSTFEKKLSMYMRWPLS